jgi:hypothetical protein
MGLDASLRLMFSRCCRSVRLLMPSAGTELITMASGQQYQDINFPVGQLIEIGLTHRSRSDDSASRSARLSAIAEISRVEIQGICWPAA